jgi:hypothetical protein
VGCRLVEGRCHGLNAKCSVQTVVLIQEELTKEERQDSYATWLLKGASYVSSCSRSHVRRRSAPSIHIGYNPLQQGFSYHWCKHVTSRFEVLFDIEHEASN